jgi:hypothetical protein
MLKGIKSNAMMGLEADGELVEWGCKRGMEGAVFLDKLHKECKL